MRFLLIRSSCVEVDSEITGIATQGRGREPYSHWVTKYYVSFREEDGPWVNFTKPKQSQPVVSYTRPTNFWVVTNILTDENVSLCLLICITFTANSIKVVFPLSAQGMMDYCLFWP